MVKRILAVSALGLSLGLAACDGGGQQEAAEPTPAPPAQEQEQPPAAQTQPSEPPPAAQSQPGEPAEPATPPRTGQ